MLHYVRLECKGKYNSRLVSSFLPSLPPSLSHLDVTQRRAGALRQSLHHHERGHQVVDLYVLQNLHYLVLAVGLGGKIRERLDPQVGVLMTKGPEGQEGV